MTKKGSSEISVVVEISFLKKVISDHRPGETFALYTTDH